LSIYTINKRPHRAAIPTTEVLMPILANLAIRIAIAIAAKLISDKISRR
jgi:hypothetical protein